MVEECCLSKNKDWVPYADTEDYAPFGEIDQLMDSAHKNAVRDLSLYMGTKTEKKGNNLFRIS
ncbi:MAG: hypothetical protein ACLTX3_08575 [Lachnospiraceae bacterium]